MDDSSSDNQQANDGFPDTQQANNVNLQADVQIDVNVDVQPNDPGVPAPPVPTQGRWTSGIFDCEENDESCILAYFCPCIAFGHIGEIVDRGSEECEMLALIYLCTLSMGVHWLYAAWYRAKLRENYGLPESPADDFLVHFFCHWCALAQEYRELTNRGFVVEDGWDANMERIAREAIQQPPPGQPTMTRGN